MPEAEDVLTDAARHATVFVRDLYRRHRAEAPDRLLLVDVVQRLDLLINATFGARVRISVAELPPPPTLLSRLARRGRGPRVERAIPATDDVAVYLPRSVGDCSEEDALRAFRCMALTQAARARRGAAARACATPEPLVRSVFVLLEAHAVDLELARLYPGLGGELALERAAALAARPQLSQFPPERQPLERLARSLMRAPDGQASPTPSFATAPDAVLAAARDLAGELARELGKSAASVRAAELYLDAWTGELRSPTEARVSTRQETPPEPEHGRRVRSARLARSPKVREASDDEDDEQPGAWMVQTAQPHEHAEDPLGMQRPTDRDAEASAEELAESVSDLAEARLVSSPGRAHEVLLSERELPRRGGAAPPEATRLKERLCYPEWDYRAQSYRDPGAWVSVGKAPEGSRAWVERTLNHHAAMLGAIRRRFDALRAGRARLRRMDDGEDVDLDAYIEAHADARAGRASAQAVYQTERKTRRDAAIMLLVDASGSTDSWVAAEKRVVDVEKEALLLVCHALARLRDPFAVLSFSGESKNYVALRTLKDFDEAYGPGIENRIAALEPEAYTRTGAALRHATARLARIPARHRLLLLLSDGKPNDVDEYEGRYGVEDTRRAVIEATLQGVHPFCLTVDRKAAHYLPQVFGAGHYALLPRPELLPYALVEWLRHLITR